MTANTTTQLRFAPIPQGIDLRTLDTVQSAVKNVEVDEHFRLTVLNMFGKPSFIE